jgi:pimeloyl-ACP methyl ester carboxylesterase/ketosteroid isomerase-like protein
MTTHSIIQIEHLNVFVREAGDRAAPAIVLLHGYPASSHMFRALIPLLAERFRVIAPDMIGYGHSDAPPAESWQYTFDNQAAIVRKVLEHLEVSSYVLYMHDFGGPVGFRIASSAPDRVRGLVVQNANAYIEGLSQRFADLFMPLWKVGDQRAIAAARGFMTAEATEMQYTAGARDASKLNPDAWKLDQALLDRPGVSDAQLAMFIDYQTNIAAYDVWQAYLRSRQPKTLVVWGKSDPFFLPAGAEAFRRDVKDAEIVLLDGGHFALEEHAETIAAEIDRVFGPRTGLELVQTFYTELGAGRLDHALGLLAKDISWNDPKGFPYGGLLTGTADIKEQVFARLAAEWSTFSVAPAKLVSSADGAAVIVLGNYRGRNRETGCSLEAPFAHVWSTVNGALVRFEVFTDTAAFHQAMGR